MILKFVSAVLFVWLGFVPAVQGQVARHLHQGDSAFAARQYRTAFDHFQEVEKSGQYTPAMLLKMAYIQEGLGRIAPSVRYLALYAKETHSKAAEKKIHAIADKYQLRGHEPDDFEKVLGQLSEYKFSITATFALFASLFVVLFFVQKRKTGQVNASILTFTFLALAGLGANQYLNKLATYGLLSQPTTYLMKGPSPGAGLISIQKEGHRVKILGQQDVWTKIKWDDKIAYVRQDQLLKINLP